GRVYASDACPSFGSIFAVGPYGFSVFVFFFFNDTATTEIYTLSLHDALPICPAMWACNRSGVSYARRSSTSPGRSEEHTSELQSRPHLVSRLLLEKKQRKKQAGAQAGARPGGAEQREPAAGG